MADHGVQATLYRIRKLGLRCKQKRKFRVTTDSAHKLPVAPNLLNREFAVSAPDKAWVSDITCIATDEGWLYLAGLKDLFNGELVGYAMSERMSQSLVMQALFRAASTKHPPKGLILHSDRGSQYCAHDYRKLLRQFGMMASMHQREAIHYATSRMWSFTAAREIAGIMHRWKASGERLKNELVHHCKF